jgi:hypothetical protein
MTRNGSDTGRRWRGGDGGGIRRFGGAGLSPTIVGGDDLTRRAAHARMDLVDGAFVLRGGGGPSTRVRTGRTACRADASTEEATAIPDMTGEEEEDGREMKE